MNKFSDFKYDLDDIILYPETLTNIDSRKKCKTIYENSVDKNFKNVYPLIVSPMDTVVDKENISLFLNKNLITCLPRQHKLGHQYNDMNFNSYSINDVIEILTKIYLYLSCCKETEYSLGIKNKITNFLDSHDYEYYFFSPHTCHINKKGEKREIYIFGECDVNINDFKKDCVTKFFYDNKNVLIDVANGHMTILRDLSKLLKDIFGDSIILMVGNIANPKTYEEYAKVGVDMVRCSIGSGNACLTSVQTAVGYGLASLIYDIKTIKESGGYDTQIILDGGIKNYSDVIKGLALGADYVMIGSLFNKCIESCGQKYLKIFGKHIKISQKLAVYLYRKNFSVWVKYRGMSTKEVQRDWGKKKLTTSEGVVRYRKVEYSLDQFLENMDSYLRSAMSYTNCSNLCEFKGTDNIIFVTNNVINRFKK